MRAYLLCLSTILNLMMKRIFTTITGALSGGLVGLIGYGLAAWGLQTDTWTDFADQVMTNPNWSPAHAIVGIIVLVATWMGYNWDD